jgi:RNA-binding protein Musashi
LKYLIYSEVLRLYFEQFGGVASVSLVCEPNGKSKGYGFITFESAETVAKVLKQVHVLDHRQVNNIFTVNY